MVARRLAAVAALLRHRVAAAEQVEEDYEYAAIAGFGATKAEVAAAMNLSSLAASYVVSDAEALDVRLPKIAALLAAGQVDWRLVRVIIRRTALVVDEALCARLDESLASRIGGWSGWSGQRVLNEVDAAVKKLDPDAAKQRRVAAHDDRYIGIRPLGDGMAEVYGRLEATTATAFDQQLSALAKTTCTADPRTLDQRRADALDAAVGGRGLACACGQPDCAAGTAVEQRVPGGAKVVINVVADEQTVFGDSARPGYLMGCGVIDAEQVRRLVATAALHVIDPFTTPAQALQYQPPAALVRAVRCRDLTCRFPGCSRPAMRCDVDHTVPFNHEDPAAGGQTVVENLKCLCRFHHLLKTFGGWRDRQLPDGTVIWTSPTGRTYRTAPAGADLFPLLGTACVAPNLKRRNRSKQRAGQINRARKHNRDTGPVNEERRRLAEARKKEIDERKWRNRQRDLLFILKGTPSTSPFCTWINDPREPEELPRDWRPEQPPCDPVPDDPPF